MASAPVDASSFGPLLEAQSLGSMPLIGLGTWRASDATSLADGIREAIRAGYRHIDCAPIYLNQKIIGEAIAVSIAAGEVTRESLFIVSKLAASDSEPEHVMAALQATLRDLQVTYLDAYLIHWPQKYVHTPSTFPVPMSERLGYSPESTLSTWRKLEECVDLGMVRSIGVSNFSSTKLEALLPAARIKPVCNQIELHPYLSQDELVRWCLARNIACTAYCPLGSPSRPATFRTPTDPPELLSHPLIARIAAEHGISPAQVLLRWAVQRGTIPLPKSVTPARLTDNLAVLSLELSTEAMAAIGGMDLGYRYSKGENMRTEGETLQQLWDE